MTNRAHETRAKAKSVGRPAPWMLLFAVTGLAPLSLAFVVSPAAFLPVVSVTSLVASALVAVVAWRLAPDIGLERPTFWDVSGACAFIGFAAAIFADPDALVSSFTMQ